MAKNYPLQLQLSCLQWPHHGAKNFTKTVLPAVFSLDAWGSYCLSHMALHGVTVYSTLLHHDCCNLPEKKKPRHAKKNRAPYAPNSRIYQVPSYLCHSKWKTTKPGVTARSCATMPQSQLRSSRPKFLSSVPWPQRPQTSTAMEGCEWPAWRWQKSGWSGDPILRKSKIWRPRTRCTTSLVIRPTQKS